MAEVDCPFKEKFNERKFADAIIHIAKQSEEDERFGAVKLNKILYFADFAAYRRLGEPITGATYYRLDQGPAPKQMLEARRRLMANEAIRIDFRPYFTGVQYRIVALDGPTEGVLKLEEVEILNEVIKALWHMTAREASDLSHQEWGWKAAKPMEDIPYPSAWLDLEYLDEEDIERGLELARELGLGQ